MIKKVEGQTERAISDAKMARKLKGIDMDEISKIIQNYKTDVGRLVIENKAKIEETFMNMDIVNKDL